MAKTDTAEPLTMQMERRIDELEAKIASLEAARASDRKVLENFMAKFGTYYNSENQGSLFIVDKLVHAGANGLALTSQQGPIELFGLPMKLKKREDSEPRDGAYWVPALIPEQAAEEIIELFDAESAAVGADSKATG